MIEAGAGAVIAALVGLLDLDGDHAEAEKVLRMLPLKYPDAPASTLSMKMPTADDVALRIDDDRADWYFVMRVPGVIGQRQGFAHEGFVGGGGD